MRQRDICCANCFDRNPKQFLAEQDGALDPFRLNHFNPLSFAIAESAVVLPKTKLTVVFGVLTRLLSRLRRSLRLRMDCKHGFGGSASELHVLRERLPTRPTGDRSADAERYCPCAVRSSPSRWHRHNHGA